MKAPRPVLGVRHAGYSVRQSTRPCALRRASLAGTSTPFTRPRASRAG